MFVEDGRLAGMWNPVVLTVLRPMAATAVSSSSATSSTSWRLRVMAV